MKKLLVFDSKYIELIKNRTLVLLWSGQTISDIGDAFFNLALMWMVFTNTNSILQTALVSVFWHISDILFSPIAGILADKFDRKRIMIVSNFLAFILVGILAIYTFSVQYIEPLIIYISILALNCLTAFMTPLRSSVLPDIVGKELLTTASGIFTSLT